MIRWWAPSVNDDEVNDAVPPVSATLPSVVAFSVIATKPVGVPLPVTVGVTVIVIVTGCASGVGLPDELADSVTGSRTNCPPASVPVLAAASEFPL